MPLSRAHATRRRDLLGLAVLGWWPMSTRAALRGMPGNRAARPWRVRPARPDAVQLAPPSAVQLGGWLGQRVRLNATRRLLNVDTEPLLAGFRHKPGSHPWIGEHVGKWLHAATLAWANNGEAALRAKLDRVAGALIDAQEPDGYLGTYPPDKRFALHAGHDWDVWSHKYCLIGLLTHHQYTGSPRSLKAARRAADLLQATFPAQRSILAAGTHLGMAATSVLEPIVMLYRLTGEPRDLAFARYLVKSWDEPGGPALVASLLAGRPMPQVANGKAYETLSNLVGLCELARLTGEQAPVRAVLAAWQDIVDKRLYATGTTSQFEHFQADHDLRDSEFQHVGETCVTTTWIQLNLALLQLTGEARFADELERSFYNHLTAAQHPDGDDWCYFTPLDGRKTYDSGITCCHSSGPRGLALAPMAAYLTGQEAGHAVLRVNTFEPSQATLRLDGRQVTVEQRSEFPFRGEAVLTLRLARPARFALKVRVPSWAQPFDMPGATLRDGWAEIPVRRWNDGEQIRLGFQLAPRLLAGTATPEPTATHEPSAMGRAALAWGPFVLAHEQPPSPGGGEAGVALPAPRRLGLTSASVALFTPLLARERALRFETEVDARTPMAPQAASRRAGFLPFADAGAGSSRLGVWLRAPGLPPPPRPAGASLLADGDEFRSRHGNVAGSIIDGDPATLVNTWDGQRADEDWFGVTLDEPATIARVVFVHGRSFHDGGWFDTHAAKPRLQAMRVAGGAWETLGAFETYPLTSATAAPGLVPGQAFTMALPSPVRLVALRVIGTPACGDRPQQAFVTCGELLAYGD